MKHACHLILISWMVVFPIHQAQAKEDKELRKQRQTAQKERQEKKNERTREINDATKAFYAFTLGLKNEYQELLKNVDLELELKQVELQADRAAKVAGAEAEYQKKLSNLYTSSGFQMDKETLKEMEEQAKAYSDELFALKKEAAAIAHKEKMASEKKKHDLLKERDKNALEEADTLGLTKEYPPILAAPIGGELTRQEEQWNEREQEEVKKIQDRNLRTIGEFVNGEKLRAWELANMEEDFKLEWDEKSELQKLETQQSFFNTLLLQATQGGKVDSQQIMAKFAELEKENKLIKIKYKQIRKTNAIKRREEKKDLQGR